MDNDNKTPPGARDGLINFAGYSTQQLVELQSNIDPQRFPLNHAHLVEELNRRETPQTRPPCDLWEIQFSRSELPLYRAEMRALMPRWGGSYEKVKDLINAAASRDSATGSQMYARLYWAYASLEADDDDFLTDSMADWSRIDEGFELLLKQYPGSDYLLNGFAYMACRAKDSNEYHALKLKLNNRLSTTAWSGHYSPEECDKKYAGNGA
jgi:hypothetical protein